MWRLRSIVALGVLVGALIFGATVAHGSWWWNSWWWNSWWWNSNSTTQGVDFRTAWKVVPFGSDTAIAGDEYNYFTTIRVRLPKGADFKLVEQAAIEQLMYQEIGALACRVNGIEAEVVYHVKPLVGAQGDTVKVWVTADGLTLGGASGPLDTNINVPVFIPAPAGVLPACYSP